MGHPVNPVSFRLGVVKSWNFISSSFENKHHYFFHNSHSWNSLIFFKRFFNLKGVEKLGLIFSHVRSFNSLNFSYYSIFFYDGFFESIFPVFYRFFDSKKFYRRMILCNRLFLKKHLFISLKKSYLLFLFGNFRKSFFFYNKFKKKFLNLLFFLIIGYLKYYYIFFILNIFYSTLFLNFSNLFIFLIFISYLKFITLNFNMLFNFYNFVFLKFDNLYFKYLNKLNYIFNFCFIKKFFVLQSIFNLNFRLRIYFFYKKLLIINKKLLRRKFLIIKFFIKFFRSFFLSIFLRSFLDKYKEKVFPSNHLNVFFNFKILSKDNITANVISKYICVRLLQRYNLKNIIKPVVQDLKQNFSIAGFKIFCCGRFTKKEITTFFFRSFRSVSLSKVTSKIDYSLSEVVLKYSVCGIKIWLQRRINYNFRRYNFNYLYNEFFDLQSKKKLKGKFKKLSKNKIYFK
jgi:hypothetical protein